MKKIVKLLALPLLVTALTSCADIFSGDNSDIHTKSYEPVTGKFVLKEVADKRVTIGDTYFDIDGSQGNFTLKYYENGALKKEGKMNRVVTREKYLGEVKDTLHFNVNCGGKSEHISTYTESLDPINQFRIIEEYYGSNYKYHLSELPFIMGTYVREGLELQEEKPTVNMEPTIENFNFALDGKFALDEQTYFYFVSPKANNFALGPYMSYFQYYSPSLTKPLEGFVNGRTYTNVDGQTRLNMTYGHAVEESKAFKNISETVLFGYYSFDANDRMLEHWGTVDFSNGELHSFSFEHLSREWTDEEWDLFTKDESYHMPDPIIADYIGGTYTKVA